MFKTSWGKFIYKENIAKKMYLGSTLVYEQRMGDTTILDAPSLWLDAADSETLIMSGSDVAQWSDKSSNSYHAVASTGRPSLSSLNGKTTVYSAINEGLWHTSAKSLLRNKSAAITAIVFSTIPSTSSYRFGFTHRGQTGSPIQARFQILANINNYYTCSSMRLDSETAFTGVITPFTADYNYHIAITFCFWETGKLYFYFDGSYIGEDAYPSSGNTSDTDVYTGTGTWLMVGGCGIGNYALQGGIGEIIVLAKSSGVYDTHWGTILEGYLAHKWGLTGNLPSDHDFKNNAPNWAFQS